MFGWLGVFDGGGLGLGVWRWVVGWVGVVTGFTPAVLWLFLVVGGWFGGFWPVFVRVCCGGGGDLCGGVWACNVF